MIRAAFVTSLVLVWSWKVAGQQPTTAFEVVSVKPNAAVDGRGSMGPQPGGRFAMVNGTVISLINLAYGLTSDDAIVGLPGWVRSARYDVNAKADEPDVSFDRMRLMLQALLADRFKFVAHAEMQEQPTYALVLARPDGRLGPNLRLAKVDCDDLMAQVAIGKAKLTPPSATGQVPPCVMRNRLGTFHSGGVTMKVAATVLYPAVRRVIIDKTGLAGYYEFELDYAPPPSPQDTEPSPLASVFTAVEEQLGLKLVPERNPVPVLVVDRIERLTPD